MISPGTYSVRPLTATLTETKSGDPQIAVEVEHTSVEHNGTRARWFGGLASDKAVELTVKTLRECGLSDSDINAITDAGAASFPSSATGSAVYLNDTDLGGNPTVRLRYLNGSERALNAPSQTARDKARAQLARTLGSATSAPAVSEKLRPFLAAVPGVTDAQSGARLWRQFSSQKAQWSPDEVKTAWAALCTRASAAEMTALLKPQPVAAPVAAASEAPPF